MHDILNGSFKDLGIVKVFGFIGDDKTKLIHMDGFSESFPF